MAKKKAARTTRVQAASTGSGLKYESYVASATPAARMMGIAATSAYKIEVRFIGGLTTT